MKNTKPTISSAIEKATASPKSSALVASLAGSQSLSRSEIIDLILANMRDEAEARLSEACAACDVARDEYNRANDFTLEEVQDFLKNEKFCFFVSNCHPSTACVELNLRNQLNHKHIMHKKSDLPGKLQTALKKLERAQSEVIAIRKEHAMLNERGLKTRLLQHMLGKTPEGNDLVAQIKSISDSFKKSIINASSAG